MPWSPNKIKLLHCPNTVLSCSWMETTFEKLPTAINALLILITASF